MIFKFYTQKSCPQFYRKSTNRIYWIRRTLGKSPAYLSTFLNLVTLYRNTHEKHKVFSTNNVLKIVWTRMVVLKTWNSKNEYLGAQLIIQKNHFRYDFQDRFIRFYIKIRINFIRIRKPIRRDRLYTYFIRTYLHLFKNLLLCPLKILVLLKKKQYLVLTGEFNIFRTEQILFLQTYETTYHIDQNIQKNVFIFPIQNIWFLVQNILEMEYYNYITIFQIHNSYLDHNIDCHIIATHLRKFVCMLHEIPEVLWLYRSRCQLDFFMSTQFIRFFQSV